MWGGRLEYVLAIDPLGAKISGPPKRVLPWHSEVLFCFLGESKLSNFHPWAKPSVSMGDPIPSRIKYP